MVRYLLKRPVAVLMIFTALLIAGMLLINKIPVSLLPNVDVPQVVIQISYPNTAADVLEQNIIAPIRENLGNLDRLKSIETRTSNHTGILQLNFEYGTKMDLAYIEVNEKLDRLSSSLPRDMQRPQVMRVNTSDIPIVRIQVIPKDKTKYYEVSRLTEKLLKRRIEQLEGVSLVDINGLQQQIISVVPDKSALTSLDLDERSIVTTIQNANKELGGLTVKDGQYRYFVTLTNVLEDEQAIMALPVILKDGSAIPLRRVAKAILTPQVPMGYHLYDNNEGLVITVQKQPGSRMNELVPRIKNLVTQFSKEYPQISFTLTQDQTFLLDAGISNLEQDLVIGGALTIMILFAFLGNWASPTLMSISIPLSLIITFIFFYLLNISFNIISLSGLALGIGMLIDNSIVVVDSITGKRAAGLSMMESSVRGTNEVMVPVISQVLTTIAVYAPLILLNGMAGILVFDQAIGLTISLCVSLLVSFVLSPLLYKMLLKKQPSRLKEDTRFYAWVASGYHKMISHVLKHKLPYFVTTIILMPIGIWIATYIPVSALPKIEKRESLILVDWNAPIDAKENSRRVTALMTEIPRNYLESEADIGIKQFLLLQGENTIQKADIYFRAETEARKIKTDADIQNWIKTRYPAASIQIIDAPNAFTQLFDATDSYFEARFIPIKNGEQAKGWDTLIENLKKLPDQHFTYGPGFTKESSISVQLDNNRMNMYGVSRSTIENVLQQQFGTYNISRIKRYGEIQTLRLETSENSLEDKLMATVIGRNNTRYPLNQFIKLANNEQAKFITSDRSGNYRAVIFSNQIKDSHELESQLNMIAVNTGFHVSFSGKHFENKNQLQQLTLIFLLVLFLLYFILAIQYESLILPVIVMLTIPLGITGGMFLLWITGGTLDIMAAIGFIVILGLIVDDPILKVETLNRLDKKYRAQGLPRDEKLLEVMIHEAGTICLKPLLMVSLTTSIALVPVLFVSGIGNDLQKPLAIVIIGGLTIGTFFTTWFIPLSYWYITRGKQKKLRRKQCK
jgi:multidrug efflux pump subunit AcrB